MIRSLSRFHALLTADLRLQVRHGFYGAYAVVTAAYVIGLRELSAAVSEHVMRGASATLIFTDPATLGAFFVGGLVLLERQQGSFAAVSVTPARVSEYVASKAVSLTALALATAVIIAAASGLPICVTPLLLSVGSTSVLFVGLGLAVAAHVRTVNGYLFAMVPVATLPMLPALRFLGFDSGFLALVPTYASIRLLETGLGGEPLSVMEMLYAVVVLPASCVAANGWAVHRLTRLISGHNEV